MKKYIISLGISLVWLIAENPIREWLLTDESVLFTADTKPVALYSFIALFCLFVLNVFCNVDLKGKRFVFLIATCFVIPLVFFQVRTEVYRDKVIFYNAVGQGEELRFDEVESVSCELDYRGKEDVEFNGVRFIYKIHFSDKTVELCGSYKERYWKNLLLFDETIREYDVEKSCSGVEYINTVRRFNKIDRFCNYPFGVFSNIDIIEDIMK